MVPMERLFTVRDSFWADAVDHSDRGRAFCRGETLWWDTELTSDPAVFQVDRFRFRVPRAEFLRCILVLTPENFRRHPQILNSPTDSIWI
jgi:hypothetical protein